MRGEELVETQGRECFEWHWEDLNRIIIKIFYFLWMCFDLPNPNNLFNLFN